MNTHRLTLPVDILIRENVAIILTYAFSRKVLEEWAAECLEGEFPTFKITMVELTAHRAERACLELAILVRYLDDEKQVSATYQGYSQVCFGYVRARDDHISPLELRDVANKIIHAAGFTWDTNNPKHPILRCHPRDGQRWDEAEIYVDALCVVCGGLVG